jgi:peptide deformylase
MISKQGKNTLLQIAELGNPIIRNKSKKVKNVKNIKIQLLINNLIATVKNVDGVGISAPQAYAPIRLFILASHPNSRYPNAPKMKPTAIINPKIISYSKDIVKDWEGCLSVPGIRGLVPRYKSIKVEYITREGKLRKREFKDFIAKIFQHEYDHLEGTVFLDKLDNVKEIITEMEYQKLMKKNEKI